MTPASPPHDALRNPNIRRLFEQAVLINEAVDTIDALREDLGISQRELADRLGVTEARVSQILGGGENLTLRSLGQLGWAMGVRFHLDPGPIADRSSTPAENDPPLPAWLEKLHPQPRFRFMDLEMPREQRLMRSRPALRVVHGGRVRAA